MSLPEPQQSPLPKKTPSEFLHQYPTLTFYDALRICVEQNAKITKLEWDNPNIFIHMDGGYLRIRLEDGLSHDLILRDVDIAGSDWVTIA